MKKAFTLLLILILNCAYSQDNSRADSLIKALKKTNNIQQKEKLMYDIATAYTINSPKGISWYNKHLAYAIKNNIDPSASLDALGIYYLNSQQYDTALQYFLRALETAKKNGRQKKRATIYSNIAIIFQEQHNFKRALYYDQKALEISRSLNDSLGIADSYMSAGINHSEMRNDKKALPIFKKALSIYLHKKDTGKTAYAYFNIGFATPNLIERAGYMEKAKLFFDAYNPNNPIAVSNLNNMGETYLFLSQDIALSAKLNSSPKSLLQKAEQLTHEAITYSLRNNTPYNLMFSYEVMAKIKEAQNKPVEALDYTRKQFTLKDSIFSQEQKNDIATTESAAEIALRDKKLELNSIMLKTKERQFWILFVGILIFTGLIVLLFIQSRARKEQNKKLAALNRELDAANKTKTQLFGIINHDLRGPVASLINFLNLQKMGVLNEAKKEELETKTMTSANGLLQSMEDLLLWSKGQMEHFSPDISPISAQSLFDDIQALYTGLPITFSNPKGIIFNSDENYLKTILRNLTANAIKAVANIPTPHIEWKAFEKDRHYYLSITDNGPGVVKETFSALYGNTTDIGIKNGLGLHLVRELATAIYCEIEVTTGSNGTTTTTITLKIK